MTLVTYSDGDLVFSPSYKTFGKIELVNMNCKDRPTYPNGENIVRVRWETRFTTTVYWLTEFNAKLDTEKFLIFPSTTTEQERLAILLKHG